MNGQRLGGLSTYQFPSSHYSIIDTRKHETNLVRRSRIFILFYFYKKWLGIHKEIKQTNLQGVGFLFYFIFLKTGLGIHKGIKQKNCSKRGGTSSHQGGVFFHENQQNFITREQHNMQCLVGL
jgi:hypothetical protein